MTGSETKKVHEKTREVNMDKDDLSIRIGGNIREMRKTLGMSLQQLAEQTNLSVALLSRIENGLVTPSIGTLRSLGDYLKVDIAHFFQRNQTSYVVSRKGARQIIQSNNGIYEVEVLADDLENQFMEPVIVTSLAKNDEQVTLGKHDGQEFCYVLEGKLEMTIGDNKIVLNQGDAIYFRGDSPHGGMSLSKKPAKTLNVHLIPGSRIGTFTK